MEEACIDFDDYTLNLYVNLKENKKIFNFYFDHIYIGGDTVLHTFFVEYGIEDIIKLLRYDNFEDDISDFIIEYFNYKSDDNKTALEYLFDMNSTYNPNLLLDVFISSKLFNCSILELKQNFVKIIDVLNNNTNENYRYDILKRIISHPTFNFGIFTNVFKELKYLYKTLFNVLFDCHNEQIFLMNNNMFVNYKSQSNYSMLSFISKYEPAIILDLYESDIFNFQELIELRDNYNETFIHYLLPHTTDIIAMLNIPNFTEEQDLIDIYIQCCNEHFNF